MPVQIDVFSPLPESWGLCLSCGTLMARAQIKDSANSGKREKVTGLDLPALDRCLVEAGAKLTNQAEIKRYDER